MTESPIKSSFKKFYNYQCVLLGLRLNWCRRAELTRKKLIFKKFSCKVYFFQIVVLNARLRFASSPPSLSGWPQTWKTQEIWKIVKISGKTQGKCKICNIIINENAFQRTCLPYVSQGKNWKYPGNLRENSGNLVSQKCGHPVCPPVCAPGSCTALIYDELYIELNEAKEQTFAR